MSADAKGIKGRGASWNPLNRFETIEYVVDGKNRRVCKKVNGQTVASTGDLARLYQQFATLSLIQAEVQRGPAIVQLSYAIQP